MIKRIALAILISWSIFPFLIQVYTSFLNDSYILEPTTAIGTRWTLNHYKQILESNPSFINYLLNSFIVSTLTTISTLLLAIPAAYSITRIRKLYRSLIQILLIAASIFPYVLLFLTLLELAREYNLGNNLILLSIPYTALSLPLAILLLIAAFNDIPIELEESALLEGLNYGQRLRHILLPLVAPTSASTAIIVFLFAWNEYPIGLTWISETNLLTVPLAISRIAASSIYSIPYGAYAAATVLGSVPLVLIMLTFQRQIVSGLTNGAIKQ